VAFCWQGRIDSPGDQDVVAGLDPAIHPLRENFLRDGWMPGSSPGMTSVFACTPSSSQKSNIVRRRGFAISPHVLREVCRNVCPRNSEGAGNAGRLMRPQPRVQSRKHTSSHHGHTGTTRHSPRNGFTAYFVLSPAIGLFCHRHLARLLARLDAGVEASGPHDLAVRLSAVRQRRRRVHRIPPHVS
jgi:hypothetical protein